jgi:phage FluMu protein Com
MDRPILSLSRWRSKNSFDIVQCASCGNKVDTPAEVASYPSGQCPKCKNPWTGTEQLDTTIAVHGPQPGKGGIG